MNKNSTRWETVAARCLVLSLAIAATLAGAETAPAPKPEFLNNFGFPLTFDVSKMDPNASPRQDFSRHAAGRWFDAATNPHPPGAYRMVAPASNHPGFYDAFGIRAGDKMWVDPKDRVTMW